MLTKERMLEIEVPEIACLTTVSKKIDDILGHSNWKFSSTKNIIEQTLRNDKGNRVIKVNIIENEEKFIDIKKIEPQKESKKNHYYLLGDDLDIIDVAFNSGEHQGFLRCLSIRYLKRAGLKDSESIIKDLEKAKYVIERWLEYEQHIAKGFAKYSNNTINTP